MCFNPLTDFPILSHPYFQTFDPTFYGISRLITPLKALALVIPFSMDFLAYQLSQLALSEWCVAYYTMLLKKALELSMLKG